MTTVGKDVILANGVHMPLFGLGTTHNGGYNHHTVLYALKECGYRLIDTATRYGTEQFVGQAIKDSFVDRKDIFLTTKLWPSDYGFQKTINACLRSLRLLQTDYLDLYLMHCPEVRDGLDRKRLLEEAWRSMEMLLDMEKCRAIGVSNFEEHHLDEMLDYASVVPHVNQVEFHPFQNPKQLHQYCDDWRIQFQGYCPLAKGMILGEAPILEISEHLGMTPAQLLLRWSLQNKVVTIPKSTKKSRVWENIQVLRDDRYEIPAHFMAVLNELPQDSSKKVVKPEQLRKSVNSDLPHGYKLQRAVNVLPKLSLPSNFF